MTKLIINLHTLMLTMALLVSSSSFMINRVDGFGVTPNPSSSSSSSAAISSTAASPISSSSSSSVPAKMTPTKPTLRKKDHPTTSSPSPRSSLFASSAAAAPLPRPEISSTPKPKPSKHAMPTITTIKKETTTATSSSSSSSTTKLQQQQTRRPRISSINSAQEFNEFLEEDDRLVIVNYYASWCKTCQKFERDFNAIGRKIGDLETVPTTTAGRQDDDATTTLTRRGVLRMATVDFGKNTELCKSRGVTKFPSVQIYSRGRLVDSFSVGGARKVPFLVEKLGRYLSMSPSELEFEADMFDGVVLGDTVLLDSIL